MFLGQPAQYPQTLVDGLKHYFSAHPEVEAACLAQVYVPASGEPSHPVVGIRLRHGVGSSIPQALPGLGDVVRQSVGTVIVDFVAIDRNDVARCLVEQTTPCYSAAA